MLQTIVVLEKVERSMFALRKILQKLENEISIICVAKPMEAMECIEDVDVDVLICNYEMEQMSCAELFDYFKMCSPYTKNIVIVEQDKIGAFTHDINRLNLHSIIIRPFPEEEFLTIIRKSLEKVNEERTRDMAYDLRTEKKKKYEEAYQKLQQEADVVEEGYNLFRDVVKGLIKGTVGTAECNQDEDMIAFFQKLSEVYDHFFFIETGNIWMYFNYYMNLFQKPQSDKIVTFQQKIQSELKHGLLAKIFYALFLFSFMFDLVLNSYHIAVELHEDTSALTIRFVFDPSASRKMDGTLDYRIESEEKRNYMQRVIQGIFDTCIKEKVNVQLQNSVILKFILEK